MPPRDERSSGALRDIYDETYRQGRELPRTSKLFTLACIPDARPLAVLDVGCGTGENSAAIAARGHTVFGVDLSAVAIEQYRRRGFDGAVMDVEAGLELPAARFDVVFCSEVIEHLAAPAVLARESFRVLKPGGLLVLSTPNSAFWLYRVLGLLGRPVSELQHPQHLQFFSRQSLRRLLTDAGFAPMEELGRNMYALLPPLPRGLERVAAGLGFQREGRFRTRSHFWHLSSRSRRCNGLLADTLICVMRRPAEPA